MDPSRKDKNQGRHFLAFVEQRTQPGWKKSRLVEIRARASKSLVTCYPANVLLTNGRLSFSLSLKRGTDIAAAAAAPSSSLESQQT